VRCHHAFRHLLLIPQTEGACEIFDHAGQSLGEGLYREFQQEVKG
jgi:hypothetical protein